MPGVLVKLAFTLCFEHVVNMPLPVQAELLEGKPVKVFTAPAENAFVLKDVADLIDPENVKQVFDKHALRTDPEKLELLRRRALDREARQESIQVGVLKVDLADDCVWHKRDRIPGSDIVEAARLLKKRRQPCRS